jgi:hypothetical protein
MEFLRICSAWSQWHHTQPETHEQSIVLCLKVFSPAFKWQIVVGICG